MDYSFFDSATTSSSSPLSSPVQSNPPNLTTQYPNVQDNNFFEELFLKIQYYNKRALNYYILIDLFHLDTVESKTQSSHSMPLSSFNELTNSNDSGLDSSFTST